MIWNIARWHRVASLCRARLWVWVYVVGGCFRENSGENGLRQHIPKVWAAFPESEWCISGRLRGLGWARCLAQEGVQYVSHQQTGGEEARQCERRRWTAFGRSFVKRKLGLLVGKEHAPPPPPKRRRTKSFVTMMQVDNMLRGSVGASLADFQIRPGADGEFADPFTWRSLNLALDMGADMVCMFHYLCYDKQLNLSADWDLAHSSSNAAKNALKGCKLWTHQVLMSAASNCVYGSTLSPPRLQQIRECVAEYFDTCTPDDPYFQFYLPHLLEQLRLGIAMTDPNVDQAICLCMSVGC